jgi:hypothetical protein
MVKKLLEPAWHSCTVLFPHSSRPSSWSPSPLLEEDNKKKGEGGVGHSSHSFPFRHAYLENDASLIGAQRTRDGPIEVPHFPVGVKMDRCSNKQHTHKADLALSLRPLLPVYQVKITWSTKRERERAEIHLSLPLPLSLIHPHTSLRFFSP